MYPPPYRPPLPVVTPPEPVRLAGPYPLTFCPCGYSLPHAQACAFSLDPEAT